MQDVEVNLITSKAFSLDEVNDLFRSKDNLVYLFQLNGDLIKATWYHQKE